jgi:hypothetical protein
MALSLTSPSASCHQTRARRPGRRRGSYVRIPADEMHAYFIGSHQHEASQLSPRLPAPGAGTSLSRPLWSDGKPYRLSSGPAVGAISTGPQPLGSVDPSDTSNPDADSAADLSLMAAVALRVGFKLEITRTLDSTHEPAPERTRAERTRAERQGSGVFRECPFLC